MPELKAVILAAGEGIRLRPLTDNRPKQLIPIAGTPILEHQIRSLAACGISEILLIVGTKKDSIQNYFGEGRSFGVRLSYAVQPAVLGTAHAIGMARNFVHDEKFLVLYGDIYVRDDAFKRVLESFEADGSVASMTVVPVSAPQFFGIAKIEQGYVKSLVEKPSSMPSVGNLANAGIFVFRPRIFEAIGKTSKSKRRI